MYKDNRSLAMILVNCAATATRNCVSGSDESNLVTAVNSQTLLNGCGLHRDHIGPSTVFTHCQSTDELSAAQLHFNTRLTQRTVHQIITNWFHNDYLMTTHVSWRWIHRRNQSFTSYHHSKSVIIHRLSIH